MLREPKLLARRSQPHEQQARAARRESSRRSALFPPRRNTRCACPPRPAREARVNIAPHPPRRLPRRRKGKPAILRAPPPRTDRSTSSIPVTRSRSAAPRRRATASNADGIAQRERAAVDDVAKTLVLLRVDHHLGAQRHDLRVALPDRARSARMRSVASRASMASRRQPKISTVALAGHRRRAAGAGDRPNRRGARRAATGTIPAANPSWFIAHFTPIGLVVEKIASMSASCPAWMRAASAVSPAR